MTLNAMTPRAETDLATREFVCLVEGCNKTFVGLFKFAAHEKYFHKLRPTERVSRRFMHICPFPPCVMEYVEREALDNHVQERHKIPNADMNPRVTSTRLITLAATDSTTLPEYPAASVGSQDSLNSTRITEQPPAGVPAGDRSGDSTNVVKISENLAEAPSSPGTTIPQAKSSFLCPILGCAQKFSDRSQLQKHEADGHRRKKGVHVCPHSQCAKGFRTEPKLKKHIRDEHRTGVQFHVVPTVAPLQPPFKLEEPLPGGGRAAKSPEAKVPIPSPSTASVHMVPPVESPQLFTCRYQGCGQQFLKLKKLGRHERGHGPASESTLLPLPCPVSNCHEKFATESLLQKHITREHIGAPTLPAKLVPTTSTGLPSVEAPVTRLKATVPLSFGGIKPALPATISAPSNNLISTLPAVPTQPKSFPKAGNVINNREASINPWLPYFMSANPYPGPIIPPHMHSPFMRFHTGNTALSNNVNPPPINPIGTPAPPYHSLQTSPVGETNQMKGRGNMAVPTPTLSTPTASTTPPITSSRTSQRQLPCPIFNCRVTFTEALDLRMHEKTVHKLTSSAQTAQLYKLLCPNCPRSYWTQEHLDAHVLTKHPTPLPCLPSVTPPDLAPLSTLSSTNQPECKPATPGGGQRTYNHTTPSAPGYSCNLCLVVFQTGAELNMHIRKSPLHRWFLEKRVGPVGTGDISL